MVTGVTVKTNSLRAPLQTATGFSTQVLALNRSRKSESAREMHYLALHRAKLRDFSRDYIENPPKLLNSSQNNSNCRIPERQQLCLDSSCKPEEIHPQTIENSLSVIAFSPVSRKLPFKAPVRRLTCAQCQQSRNARALLQIASDQRAQSHERSFLCENDALFFVSFIHHSRHCVS